MNVFLLLHSNGQQYEDNAEEVVAVTSTLQAAIDYSKSEKPSEEGWPEFLAIQEWDTDKGQVVTYDQNGKVEWKAPPNCPHCGQEMP